MPTAETSRLGSGKGSGCKSTAFTTLKIVVVAPIPSARVRMATAAKPGLFASIRSPYRTSCHSVCIVRFPDSVKFNLFVTQCRHRIDLRGALRWEIGGHAGHRQQ